MNATESKTPAGGRAPFRIWIILAAVAAAMFAYIMIVGNPMARQSSTESAAIGRQLSYFQLDPLTGSSTTVSLDDLRGRVTLVNFWGTWCPPCREEFPHIVDIAAKFSDSESFRLYAVSSGKGDDKDLGELRNATMEFLSAQGVTLATYADQNAATRRAMMLTLNLDGFGYPTTLVVDQHGTIRGFWVGYRSGTEKQIESLVTELLKNPAA